MLFDTLEKLKQIPAFDRLELSENTTILHFNGILGDKIRIEVDGEFKVENGNDNTDTNNQN